jgi:septal ring factor EnvC (AmiA/AmiB activator)
VHPVEGTIWALIGTIVTGLISYLVKLNRQRTQRLIAAARAMAPVEVARVEASTTTEARVFRRLEQLEQRLDAQQQRIAELQEALGRERVRAEGLEAENERLRARLAWLEHQIESYRDEYLRAYLESRPPPPAPPSPEPPRVPPKPKKPPP